MPTVTIPSELIAGRTALNNGFGTLLVTDLSALLVPNGDPRDRQTTYDSFTVQAVMDLGDWSHFGSIHWYIVTDLPVLEAKAALDGPLSRYFNGYCQAKLWINVAAFFLGAEGEGIAGDWYGFSDEQNEVGLITVFPREYWLGLHPSGDPAQCDWTNVMRRVTGEDFDGALVMLADLDRFVPTGPDADSVVIVRPADTELGFTATGFNVHLP